MNATITVVQVGTKEVKTRFGAKPTYSFKGSDGQWYKTAFKEVAHVGDSISFDYTPGTYGNEVNVDTIVKSGAAPAAPAAAVVAAIERKAAPAPISNKGSFPIGPLDGQRSIVRQNALTNARELFGHMVDTGHSASLAELHSAASSIIGLAKVFESYTTGDADLAEVKGEMAAAEKKAA